MVLLFFQGEPLKGYPGVPFLTQSPLYLKSLSPFWYSATVWSLEVHSYLEMSVKAETQKT